MRKLIVVLGLIVLLAAMTACGNDQKQEAKEDKDCEIAMISESPEMNDNAFSKLTWSSVQSFADENEATAKSYEPKEATKEGYLASVKSAAEDGAKVIVLAGSSLETAAYDAQKAYPDIKFLLVDGVPHDEKDNYSTAANTVSIVFAEEEAGYMAGYAAVKGGYTKLGFMGGQELPYVKRYGYGFVQGAAAAAAETETKVEMRYAYAGSSAASEETQNMAAQWYKDGTEAIFVSGGAMTDSVTKAAEKGNGVVIGTDLDESSLSDTVVMSATKGIDTAVKTVLEAYEDDTFVGGTAFNYAAKNDGVKLEMNGGELKGFSEDDYRKLFRQLKNEKIELKKDTGVGSVSELTGEWVTIKK